MFRVWFLWVCCFLRHNTAMPLQGDEAYARVHAHLRQSMTQYTALRDPQVIRRHMAKMMQFDGCLVIVMHNRVFATRRFMTESKHRKHAMMLLSAAQFMDLPNTMYLFDKDSTGEVLKDNLDLVGEDGEFPIAVISKKSGYDKPGILVPNPFFAEGNLTRWGIFVKALTQHAEASPWSTRDPRLFWRGSIIHRENCSRDNGNYDRLAASSLTMEDPNQFDVRCSRCSPRNESANFCPELRYDALMHSLVAENCSSIEDSQWVEAWDYAKYRYVLNLAGATSGGYSRNLNHLWALGAVVVLWASDVVEWYYPGLRTNKTHLYLDKSNASAALAALEKAHRGAPMDLVRNARIVNDNLICPRCIATYMRDFAVAVRERFGHHYVLDDPRKARDFFDRHCTIPDLFELVQDVSDPHAVNLGKFLIYIPVPADSPFASCLRNSKTHIRNENETGETEKPRYRAFGPIQDFLAQLSNYLFPGTTSPAVEGEISSTNDADSRQQRRQQKRRRRLWPF